MLHKVISLATLALAANSQNIIPTFLFAQAGISDASTGLDISVGDPPPPVEECSDIAFCMRTREYRRDTEQQRSNADLQYYVASHEFNDEEGSIEMDLQMQCEDTGYLASKLTAKMWFYQNGIARVVIGEPDNTRFQISQEELPVVWDQLEAVQALEANHTKTYDDQGKSGIIVADLERNSCHSTNVENFTYTIQFKPFFQVTQMSNDVVTQVINPSGSLYVEDMFSSDSEASNADDTCFAGLRERTKERTGTDWFGPNTERKESISLGFWYATTKLFGLPEREDTLALRRTDGGKYGSGKPYKIWATDQFAHIPESPQALYGSIPYINGQSDKASASSLWVNSARTFVDIQDSDMDDTKGSKVTFSSSSGALEVFMFASTAEQHGPFNRVKYVSKDLATVTGFAAMPMIQTLGYHFCKYANVSAEMLMQRNRDFSTFGYPLDVVWSDIAWSDQNGTGHNFEYFKFNAQNFTAAQVK